MNVCAIFFWTWIFALKAWVPRGASVRGRNIGTISHFSEYCAQPCQRWHAWILLCHQLPEVTLWNAWWVPVSILFYMVAIMLVYLKFIDASILWFFLRLQALVEDHIFTEYDAQHTIGSVFPYQKREKPQRNFWYFPAIFTGMSIRHFIVLCIMVYTSFSLSCQLLIFSCITPFGLWNFGIMDIFLKLLDAVSWSIARWGTWKAAKAFSLLSPPSSNS